MESIYKYLEENMLQCDWKKYYEHGCPGCGTQRSLLLLLKGQIWEAIVMYPPIVPVTAFIVYTLLHLIFKFKHGTQVITWIVISGVIISLTNYVIRIIMNS